MARGWESKSVESQMDAAGQDKSVRPSTPSTPAEREKIRIRAGLTLAKAHLTAQMQAASSENYRQTLRLAMEEIDRKLKLDDEQG